MFVLVSGFTLLKPQDDWVLSVIGALNKFNNAYPQEKVYLHIDRSTYFKGEDIWFKAHILNGSNHIPSTLSSIVYVELVGKQDSLIKKLTLRTEKGVAQGDFRLSQDIPEGVYRIRAYTNWMSNFDEHYFFSKDIKIWNTARNNTDIFIEYDIRRTRSGGDSVKAKVRFMSTYGNPVVSNRFGYRLVTDYDKPNYITSTTDAQGFCRIMFYISPKDRKLHPKLETNIRFDQITQTRFFDIPSSDNQLDVQFFPEGGNLLEGMVNRVAFKAVNTYGKGVFVTGIILDKDSAKVLDFQTTHVGMGTFRMQIKPGQRYTAAVRLGDGTVKYTPLPTPKKEGFMLNVSTAIPDTFMVKVYLSDSLHKAMKGKEIAIIGQVRQTVFYAVKVAISDRFVLLSIPASEFPAGIVQFTLFDNSGIPQCERLVFNRRNQSLNITVKPEKTVYAARERVWVDIQVTGPDGKGVKTNLSVSVTDADKATAPEEYKQNMVSALLLTSDLKGYIEQPYSYFDPTNHSAAKQIDLVMLTNGWRRFEWKKILNNQFPNAVQPVEQGLVLSGKFKSHHGKPIADASITLLTTSGRSLFLSTQTDAKGSFSFSNLQLADSTKLVLQGLGQGEAKTDELSVDLPYQQGFGIATNPFMRTENIFNTAWNLPLQRETKYIKRPKPNMREIQLEAVEIRRKRDGVYKQEGVHSSADYFVKGEDLRAATGNVLDALMGRVAGMQITADPSNIGNYNISIRGVGSMNGGSSNPLFVVDGMQFEDVTIFQTITLKDVEYVEVLKNAANTAAYGSRGSNGVIVVKTKRGQYNEQESDSKNILKMQVSGYYVARVFYAPRYDLVVPDKEKPDERLTLHWEPFLQTNAEGKARLTFFNADNISNWRIVAEGLSTEGLPGSADVVVGFGK